MNFLFIHTLPFLKRNLREYPFETFVSKDCLMRIKDSRYIEISLKSHYRMTRQSPDASS